MGCIGSCFWETDVETETWVASKQRKEWQGIKWAGERRGAVHPTDSTCVNEYLQDQWELPAWCPFIQTTCSLSMGDTYTVAWLHTVPSKDISLS